MNTITVFEIIAALLLLLGGLLYLAAQFIIRKMGSDHSRLQDRKLKLWIWRAFILVLFGYCFFLLVANKPLLEMIFEGPLSIILMIIIIIFLSALVELVVIDLLLPDVVQMWKRILIEVIVFALLCGLTIITFNISIGIAASVV